MVEQKSQKISTSDRADEEHGAANGYDEEGLELRAKMPRSDSMPMMPDPSAMDWSAAGVREMLRPYMNKGSISNCATFSIMLVGMLLKAATAGTECGAARTFGQECARWILAAGLFGFAGGITNWVAIKMLFDRVCNLPGSGVIPRRFKEIRQVIKDTIMKTFFDGPYLEAYMNKKMASLATELNLGPKLKELLETPEVDEMVTKASQRRCQPPPPNAPYPQLTTAAAFALLAPRQGARGPGQQARGHDDHDDGHHARPAGDELALHPARPTYMHAPHL